MSLVVESFGDRVWTPAEIGEAIGADEDWRRYEIVDGVLIVSPHAVPLHQFVADQLVHDLRDAVPYGFAAISSVGIDLGRSYRVTDATVVDRRVLGTGRSLVLPSEVLVVVEIESPSSVTTDRVTKPAQYAAAGIAHYWRVELDPLRLNTYRLAGGLYESTGSWAADEAPRITDPFDVTIDLSTLLP